MVNQCTVKDLNAPLRVRTRVGTGVVTHSTGDGLVLGARLPW